MCYRVISLHEWCVCLFIIHQSLFYNQVAIIILSGNVHIINLLF